MGAKYILTENQLDKFISKYIGGFFGGLKEVDESQKHNLKFFVDENNKIIFYYATDSGNLYLEEGIKNHIINHLENVFDLGWWNSKVMLEEWFLENYGIKVYRIYNNNQ